MHTEIQVKNKIIYDKYHLTLTISIAIDNHLTLTTASLIASAI